MRIKTLEEYYKDIIKNSDLALKEMESKYFDYKNTQEGNVFKL